MKISIVLITKGRRQHIQECLDSIANCLKTDRYQALIFDNGSIGDSARIINEWATVNSVEVIRYETNEPRFNRVFHELKRRGLGWVVFPGDDDKILVEGLNEICDKFALNKEVEAIAASVSTIDGGGKNLKKTRFSVKNINATNTSQLAQALSEPPFLWPAFIFKANLLPDYLPSSRFAWDWSIFLHFILRNTVLTSTTQIIEYREHIAQESNLAGLNRKYLENAFWMIEFIDSEEFVSWINTQSEIDLMNFIEYLLKYKPIYFDQSYSKIIVFLIFKTILATTSSVNLKAKCIFELSHTFGVFLHEKEICNFVSIPFNFRLDCTQNFNIEFAPDVCEEVSRVSYRFKANKYIQKVHISCRHAGGKKRGFLVLDCNRLTNLSEDDRIDLILVKINEFFESQGENEKKITPGEYFIISFIRRIRNLVPGWIITFLNTNRQNR